MHENGGIHGPNGVSEALKAVEFVPLTGLRLVDFKLDVLAHGVSAAANNYHHCADEDACVLVAC